MVLDDIKKGNALFHGFTFTRELTDTTIMFGDLLYKPETETALI